MIFIPLRPPKKKGVTNSLRPRQKRLKQTHFAYMKKRALLLISSVFIVYMTCTYFYLLQGHPLIDFFLLASAFRATHNSLRSRVYNSQRGVSIALELLAVSQALAKLVVDINSLITEKFVISKLTEFEDMVAGSASSAFGPDPAQITPKRVSGNPKKRRTSSSTPSTPLVKSASGREDRIQRLKVRRKTLHEAITRQTGLIKDAETELSAIDDELGTLVEDEDRDT